jgi:hypothetical protein
VPDGPPVARDRNQREHARHAAQTVDQIRLACPPERKLVHLPDRVGIVPPLASHSDFILHARISLPAMT